MGKKKKKKVIAKRKSQVKAKQQKRAKIKSRKSTPNIQFVKRAAISDIATPPGFRAVSMSQGMMEYAKPIMDYVEKGIVDDPDKAFQLVMPLWNYDISMEENDFTINKKDIIKQIGKNLKINSKQSTELFEMMIQRKRDLFPKEIQPDNPMTMFIKQEEHYLISTFNYDSLKISEEIYTPGKKDEQLIELIDQMDEYIAEDTDYMEWEEFYFELEEKCKERFEKWLIFKGVKEYSEAFPYNVEIYLNFIYRYMHEDEINLKTVTPIYIEEFFVDHVLRKVMVEPHEYIEWPPALKLFYNFLNEIGYLERPQTIIKLLDKIEPVFIKILQTRYS